MATFKGIPNQLVSKYDSIMMKRKPLFRFNEQGEYYTEDKKLIRKLKLLFKMKEEEQEQVQEEQPKVENNEIIKVNKKEVKAKEIICKDCQQTFPTVGEFLLHRRREHKKEGKK